MATTVIGRAARLGRVAALLAGVAALCGGAAAPAAGAWTAPFDVVALHEPVRPIGAGPSFTPFAQVASSEAITAFAWTNLGEDGFRVQARTRSAATGKLSPILDLAGDERPLNQLNAVAAGPGGHVVFIWSPGGFGTPMQVQLLVGGRLRRPVDLSGSGYLLRLGQQDVQVDADGNVVIASLTYDKRVQLQRLSAAGELGPLVTVDRPSIGFGQIALAVAPSGNAVVAWDNSRPEDRRLLARTASVAGRLGPVVTLWQGVRPRRAQSPVAGVSDSGDAVVVWRSESRSFDDHRRAQSRRIGVDGTLGPILDLSRRGHEDAYDVRVAPSGWGVVLWDQRPAGAREGAGMTRARLLSADGGRGAKLDVPGIARSPALSISDRGRVIFAWVTARGTVLARTLAADGALGPIRRLSDRGERATVDPYEPSVAISSGARPVVTWVRGTTVRAAVGP